MKVVIIILILVVIGFAVAIGVAVYRATAPPAPPSAHGPPTNSRGEIDEDALADWEPPPMAALMGRLSRPFAPKLLKKAVEISGKPGSGLEGDQPGTLPVDQSDKKMRIARLRLLSGQGAVARYECGPPRNPPEAGDEETCPQVVCLCPEGAIPEEGDIKDCGTSWRNARSKTGDGLVHCRAKDDDVSAVIYRRGGRIEITPMGDQSSTVSIR
jgi:hypothetical protein